MMSSTNEPSLEPSVDPWHVVLLDVVSTEARKLLNEEQFQHVLDEFLRMASHTNPLHCPGLSFTAVPGKNGDDEFFIARDRGGLLTDLDLRIFFALETKARNLVVLGLLDIPHEARLSNAVAILMRYRLRRFLET
jgi:hypothetical protein